MLKLWTTVEHSGVTYEKNYDKKKIIFYLIIHVRHRNVLGKSLNDFFL